MKDGLIAEIRLFLIIFIVILFAVFLTFNATSLVAQFSYAFNGNGLEKGERVASLLPVVETPDGVYISKTGTYAPLVIENSRDEKVLYDALKSGVLLYPGSVNPGENGSTVILGHSSGFAWSEGNYKSVFALLNKLEEGDLIRVYFEGEEFTYKVQKSDILSVSKVNDAVNHNNPNNNTLFLSSCWPIGTAWNRIVITAELI